MRILRVVYVLAIAVALTVLVIVGVQTFYPAPEYPDCYELLGQAPDYNTPGYDEWERQCANITDEYEQQTVTHDRNTFCIVLPLGVIFAVVGTLIQRRTGIFWAALVLGGVGTMIFAVIPYNLDDIPRFIGIALILAVLIFVGYKAFLSSRRS